MPTSKKTTTKKSVAAKAAVAKVVAPKVAAPKASAKVIAMPVAIPTAPMPVAVPPVSNVIPMIKPVAKKPAVVSRSIPVVTMDEVPGREIADVVGEVIGVVATSSATTFVRPTTPCLAVT